MNCIYDIFVEDSRKSESEKNEKYRTRERKEGEEKPGSTLWDHRNLGKRILLHGDNVNVFTLDSVLV